MMDYTEISKADKAICQRGYVCAMRLDHDGVRDANIALLQARFRHMDPDVRQRAKSTVQDLRGQMGRT